VAHPLLPDLDPESVLLFNASAILKGSASHNFVRELYKLGPHGCRRWYYCSVGITGEGTLDAEDDTIPSVTSLVTPRRAVFPGGV